MSRPPAQGAGPGRDRPLGGDRGLRPWRVSGTTAQRLGVLFVVVLVWDLVLALDGHIPAGWAGGVIAATVVCYPCLAVVCALALGQPPPGWLVRWRPQRVLVVAPALTLVMAVVVGLQVPGYLRSRSGIGADVTAATLCAAQDVLAGRDPYRTPEVACLGRLHASILVATPLARGRFAGRRRYPSDAALRRAAVAAGRHEGRSRAFPVFGYPPMSFVWMLPVARAGPTARVAWTLAGAAVWLVVTGLAAGWLWPAVVMLLLLQFGGGSVLAAAAQGDGEFFAYALATLALVLLDRQRWSAVLLALAAATNPLTWVIVPGYVVLAARLPRPSRRLGWFAAALAAAVVPWLLVYRDAGAAIVALVRQPAYAYGIGLVTELGPAPAPVLRTVLFAVAALGLALVVGVCAWRGRWTAAAPAVAVALLWASWRSDANYLAQLFPLAVSMAVGLHRCSASPPIAGRRAVPSAPAEAVP